MKSLVRGWMIFAGLSWSSVSLALSQGTTAVISGTVRDQSGAVLPGASIQVTHQATGRVRTVSSDSAGRFRFPALELGTYEAKASLPGFRTVIQSGVALTVDSEAVVDLALEVGQVADSITVTEETPLVQTTSAQLSGLVGSQEIRDLPLNGRDYAQLAFLQPGVVQFTNSSGTTSSRALNGGGLKMSVAGTPTDFSSFLLDGTDLHDHANFTPGSVARTNLGVDSILEFRVLTQNYSAEYGRTAGGIVSAVTRSGSNSLHGTAFEFLRNNALDARQFFDPGGTNPFRRNQFGAAAGGPIRRDRTFFYVNYEGLRERLALTHISNVPTAAARSGILPTGNVTVAAAIRPYLDLFPLPNKRDFGDGTGEYYWSYSDPTREDYGSVRIDHQFSDQHYLFGRMTIDDSIVKSARTFPSFQDVVLSRNIFTTLEEKAILSPSLLNVFRMAFNRTNPRVSSGSTLANPEALAFIPGRVWSVRFAAGPAATGSLLSELGFLTFAPGRFTQNIYQFSDDLHYQRGPHSLRMGVNLERIQMNIIFNQNLGQQVFPTIQSFLTATPNLFQGVTLDFQPGFGLRQWLTGLYLQDDLRASDTLNLNLGLRWEFITNPSEVRDQQANVLNVMTDRGPTFGRVFTQNESLQNFAPRFGFAWTPFGEKRPVIRGGVGVFFNQITGRLYYANARSGFTSNVNLNNPPFPNPRLETVATGTVGYLTFDPEPKTPTVYQYNLTVEQQLPAGFVLTAGYAGSHGVHWIRQIESNTTVPRLLDNGTPFYPAGPRVNPALGSVLRVLTDANSSYNSLQVQVTRRISRGLQMQGSYTYAKNLTDGTMYQPAQAQNTADASQIPFNRSANRGLSSFDQRQVLTVNYTYRLPGDSLEGMAGVVGKGWEISGIVSAGAGTPLTAGLPFNRAGDGNSRSAILPNLKAGRSNNPILGKPERYFDPTAFELQPAGFYGNLGQNTLIGPGVSTVDLSFVKNFRFNERHSLAFRSEFFNLFNRANFGLPNRFVFTATGAVAGTAGVIQTLNTHAREIQFGLRYAF